MSRLGPHAQLATAVRLGPGDPVELEVRAPGPAGLASLDLLDGAAELLVDVAEPDQLVGARIDDPSSEGGRRLASILLGPAGAARLEGSAGEPTVVWDRSIDGHDAAARGRRGTAPGGLGLIGRAALAMGELRVPGLDLRARSAGMVDAGVLGLDLGPDLVARSGALDLVRAGLDRWETIGRLAFIDLDDAIAAELLRRGRRWWKVVATADELLGRRLLRLLDDVPEDRSWPGRAAGVGGMRAGAPAPPAPAAARPSVVHPAALEVAADLIPSDTPFDVPITVCADLVRQEPEVASAEVDGRHLTVHVDGLPDLPRVRDNHHHGGAWLRIFGPGRRPDLVALAPFDGGRSGSRHAVALLPPDVDPRHLRADVTVDPAQPAFEPAASIARAAAVGADAARQGRLGRRSAPNRWLETADEWETVGDDHRAGTARALAEVRRRPDPLVVDLLDDAG